MSSKHLSAVILTVMLLLAVTISRGQSILDDLPVSAKAGIRPNTIHQFFSEKDPAAADEFFMKAIEFIDSGDEKQARLYLDSSIISNPDLGDAYLLRASIYSDLRWWKEAARDIKKADELGCSDYFFPVNAWIKINTGDTLGLAKDVKQTMMLYDHLGFAHFINANYKFWQFDTACLSEIQKAIDLEDNPYYRVTQLTWWFIIPDVEISRDTLLTACKRVINHPESDTLMQVSGWLFLGSMYGIDENLDSLFICFDKAYKLLPLHIPLVMMKAAMCKEKEQYDEMRSYLIKAESLCKADPEVMLNIANFYLDLEDTTNAFRVLDTAILVNPTANLYGLRAFLYMMKGDYDHFNEDNEKLSGYQEIENSDYVNDLLEKLKSRMYPDSGSADFFAMQGEYLIAEKKYEEAILMLNKALEIDPKNTYALRKRGIANFLKGNKKEGCKDLHLAAELGDQDALQIVKESCEGY